MNTDWTLDRKALASALERWLRTSPSPEVRGRVNDWLMDLALDPLWRGQEDGDTGIFLGRVVGTNVGITYVPDADKRRVYVSDIYDVS